MRSYCPGSSSGKPNTQPGAVRWAVEASITRTAGFSIMATASRAASSGRHRITRSASLRAPAIRKVNQLEVAPRGQPLAYFEAGGARRPVDEDSCRHEVRLCHEGTFR